MSETPELPPLPEPKYIYHGTDDDDGGDDLFEFAVYGAVDVDSEGRACHRCERLFTAEQMRQFWAAGRRAGLEEAAKLCYEVDAKLFAEALVCTAGDCAEAIRAACGGTGRAKP